MFNNGGQEANTKSACNLCKNQPTVPYYHLGSVH